LHPIIIMNVLANDWEREEQPTPAYTSLDHAADAPASRSAPQQSLIFRIFELMTLALGYAGTWMLQPRLRQTCRSGYRNGMRGRAKTALSPK